MKFLWYSALAVLMLAPAADAQLAVYGEGQAVRFDDQASGSTNWFKGGTFGVYDDVVRLPLLGFGVDARGTFASNGDFRFRSGMIGLRADAKAPVLPFRPYVEGLVGVGGTKSLVTSIYITPTYSNKFEYEVLGGLDFTIFPHVDLRLPEVGWGQISTNSDVPNSPASKTLGLSAGLVIRLF